MSAIYSAFLSGVVSDNPLASGATTLNASALSGMPVVAAPDYMWLVLDPNGVNGLPEIVKVTAHTASAASCTITRGQQTSQGGAAAHAHPQNTPWVVSSTPADFDELPFRKVSAKGDLLAATGANAVTRLGVGTDGAILTAASGQTAGLSWTSIGVKGQTLVVSGTGVPAWGNGYTVCTSATRPSVPQNGMSIYETDTHRAWVYDSGWMLIGWGTLAGRPGVGVVRASNLTVSNGAVTDVTYTSETWDPDGWTSAGSATMTVPTGWTGLYAVSFRGSFASNPACWTILNINGTNYAESYAGAATGNISLANTVSLTQGDTLRLQVFQSSGVAQTLALATLIVSWLGG